MEWKKEERPLSEWTGAEIKAFCKERTIDGAKNNFFECHGCMFNHVVCNRSPSQWFGGSDD